MSHRIKFRDAQHKRYRYDKSWSLYDTDWFTILERHIRNVCDKPVVVSYCYGHMNARDARLRGSLFSNSRGCVNGTEHRFVSLGPNEEKHAREYGRPNMDDLQKFLFGVCQEGFIPKRVIRTKKFNCHCDTKKGCPSIRKR